MPYYCYIDSPSGIGKTNLQLYSLQQAAKSWNEAVEADGDPAALHVTERLAFILNALGLSLSQLLGQNCPSLEKKRMDNPRILLRAVLSRASVDRADFDRLDSTFGHFISYYDPLRHFGKNKDEAHYRKVDELALAKVKEFIRMTVEIWDVVIAIHREDEENEFDDFKSIAEVIEPLLCFSAKSEAGEGMPTTTDMPNTET
jgi:hypothetical protein